jgi:GGDEF domain-containing protein
VHQLADRFARMIATHKFSRLSQHAPGTVSISGGIATFPWDCISPAELLSKADAALLAAKRSGKNVIRVGK